METYRSPQIRFCRQCQELKLFSKFYKNSKNGYFSKCKNCISKKNLEKWNGKRIVKLKVHQQFLKENNLYWQETMPIM